MKFTQVTIKNYRSIRELTLELSEKGGSFCHILAGINESGKSNILHALSLVSKKNKVKYVDDINKRAEGEKIQIICTLDKTAGSRITEYLKENQTAKSILQKLHIEKVEYIREFTNTGASNTYFSILLSSTPNGKYTHNSRGCFSVALNTQKESTDKHKAETEIEEEAETAGAITQEGTSSGDKGTAEPQNAESPQNNDNKQIETADDWADVLSQHYAQRVLGAHLPKVIFWKYDAKYLIDQAINLKTFKNDLSISKPLYNIFRIAGYATEESIKRAIDNALSSSNKMGELSDKLRDATQGYLRRVWPEHKVRIEVLPANPKIEFQIKEAFTESGRYGVGQRSDGFKHFFTILLNLAAENLSEDLKDALVLLDEPELHLHPSGARFLRDELINIAKNNTLIYSTHSIFMIDTKYLPRHYKVQKDTEFTEVLAITSEDPFGEELIYEALGTSVFQLIREHNLLVEGSTDKKLIEAFTKKFKREMKPLEIYIISVEGESSFDKYLHFFNNRNVRGYVLCDSDSAGSKAKNKIINGPLDAYNTHNTFEIADLISVGKGSSIEDLLPLDVLEKCISASCNLQIQLSSNKTLKEQVDQYNKTTASPKINLNKLKNYICSYVCKDVSSKNTTKAVAKDKYSQFYSFIEALHSKLKTPQRKKV